MELININQILVSPLLFFLLGFFGKLYSNELKLSRELSKFLSVYLLLAIGIKGGIALKIVSLIDLLRYFGIAILFSLLKTLIAFNFFWVRDLEKPERISIAAHYGSVSVTTFAAGISFLNEMDVWYEPYPFLVLVFMEFPSVFFSLMINRFYEGTHPQLACNSSIKKIINTTLKSSSVVLLLGALAIGYFANPSSIDDILPFYEGCFQGMMTLFILHAGMKTAEKVPFLLGMGLKPIFFAVGFSMMNATIAIVAGFGLNLSPGAIFLLSLLGASASYITAPSALKLSCPDIPAVTGTALSLGLTFPFNLLLGIPVYYYIISKISILM